MDDTTAAQPPEQPTGPGSRGDLMHTRPIDSLLPTPGFLDLSAPDPVGAAPPTSARATAFAAILIGGLLGGLVGYGIGDILYPATIWSAVGALAGALTGAIGLGVLANLTLRAMNEWKTATHPESAEPDRAANPSDTNSGAS